MVIEFKARANAAQFARNKCLRSWMDEKGKRKYDLNKYCKVLVLAKEFEWAGKLNSQACQASAEQAWSAIAKGISCGSDGAVTVAIDRAYT